MIWGNLLMSDSRFPPLCTDTPPETLLRVNDLQLELAGNGQRLLHQVSFSLSRHGCVGIVGESGSGKSLACQALMGVLGPEFIRRGDIWLDGTELLSLNDVAMRRLCGRMISLIPQQPMTAFDPLQSVGGQMVETLRAHLPLGSRAARDLALEALAQVQLRQPQQIYHRYPAQLSGGILQRITIAIALALKPTLLIADEPTTALDSVTQQDIMRQFMAIREQWGTSLIFVSHDLGLVSRIADNVMVMQYGRTVEQGSAASVLHQPCHPHTRQLVASRQMLQQRYSALTASAQEKYEC